MKATSLNRLMAIGLIIIAMAAGYTALEAWRADDGFIAMIYAFGTAYILVLAAGWWRGAFRIKW